MQEEAAVNESGMRDHPRESAHHPSEADDGSVRRDGVDEGHPADTAAEPGGRLSRKQVLVVVLIVLLVAGAAVAHLLTGPGVTH